jgi:hypothetical protein
VTVTERAYRAESAVFHGAPLIAFPAAAAFAREVLRHHLPGHRVEILPGDTVDSEATGSRLTFPRSGIDRATILHEIAHLLDMRTEGALPADTVPEEHGWRWAHLYLKLVGRFMGRRAGQLRESFRRHGVPYRRPEGARR